MIFRKQFFMLWGRIPVKLRRGVAHFIISLLSPKPDPAPSVEISDKQLPKIVVGFLSSPSGLGQSARLSADALVSEGYTVYGIDLSRYFYEMADTIAHQLPDGKSINGPAHVIIKINAPYLPYVLFLLGRSFLKEKYITGYWVWELPQLPASWNRGFACVHDIAVPSAFVAKAVTDCDSSKMVRMAPYPVALDLPPLSPLAENAKRPEQPFTIISVINAASGFERKNPLALIAAFKLAFGHASDVRLRLLIANTHHYPHCIEVINKQVKAFDNIEISWRSLDRRELWYWWGTPDIYASLHRSEGFGLPLAEAMCAGYPVVATGWSGNMQFMTKNNSFPLDYSLIDVLDPQDKYTTGLGQWADADIAQAAEILTRLKQQPQTMSKIAKQARLISQTAVSTKNFCKRISGNITDSRNE